MRYSNNLRLHQFERERQVNHHIEFLNSVPECDLFNEFRCFQITLLMNYWPFSLKILQFGNLVDIFKFTNSQIHWTSRTISRPGRK